MSYFKDVILPSVEVPYKPTYNLTETCKILDCHYTTLAGYVSKGVLNVTINRRVYAYELENFFNLRHTMKP